MVVVARERARIFRGDRQQPVAALVSGQGGAHQHVVELFAVAGGRVRLAVRHPDGHRRDVDVLLRALHRTRLRQYQGSAIRRELRAAAAQSASMGRRRDGGVGLYPHGAGVFYRRLSRRPGAELAGRSSLAAGHADALVYRLFAALGPARLLGDHGRNQYRAGRPRSWGRR